MDKIQIHRLKPTVLPYEDAKMARVTVEDCLQKVENRFELVLVASKRARQISNGAEPTVEWDNDKPTVIALRELAEDTIDPETVLSDPDTPPFFC